MPETNTMTSKLEALGLTAAAKEVERQKAMAAKLDVAYTHFRFADREKIAAFNERLCVETIKRTPWNTTYAQLTFTALSDYPSVPPTDVLTALESAQGLGCFDRFMVAQITEQSIPKPDPIIFGLVDGCTDLFFIAQWDDDVKIEDILKADEGYFKGVKV